MSVRASIVSGAEFNYVCEVKRFIASSLNLLFAIGCLAAEDAPFSGGKWVDLTHEFSADTLYWPTAENFTLETEFHGQTPKGYFYAANRYRASEDGGRPI